MVVIDIIKFLIFKHIKLDSENMIGRISVIGEIEQPQMLSRTYSVDAGSGCEQEGKPMAGEAVFVRRDGKNEGEREGEKVGRVG